MKKVLFVLIAGLLLGACGSNEADKSHREDFNINNEIDDILATEALNVYWSIEDAVLYDEEIEKEELFNFTDRNFTDKEVYEELNDKEQNLVVKTSEMISKHIRDVYDDKDILEVDIDEFNQVLETGYY